MIYVLMLLTLDQYTLIFPFPYRFKNGFNHPIDLPIDLPLYTRTGTYIYTYFSIVKYEDF